MRRTLFSNNISCLFRDMRIAFELMAFIYIIWKKSKIFFDLDQKKTLKILHCIICDKILNGQFPFLFHLLISFLY